MSVWELLDRGGEADGGFLSRGQSRIPGVVTAVVVENYHREHPGQVRVRIPVRDEEDSRLQWVRAAVPYAGKSWGFYFQPEAGDQVLLAFEQGNPEKPYIIGALPREGDAFETGLSDEKNRFKSITGRNGTRLLLADGKEDGTEDSLIVETAKGAHTIVMDNEKKEIRICDSERKCEISCKTEKGELQILAAEKLTIKIGDSITLRCSQSTGNVELDAKKLTVKTSGGLTLGTDGALKLSGGQVNIESTSQLKVASSGAVKIEGSTISLG